MARDKDDKDQGKEVRISYDIQQPANTENNKSGSMGNHNFDGLKPLNMPTAKKTEQSVTPQPPAQPAPQPQQAPPQAPAGPATDSSTATGNKGGLPKPVDPVSYEFNCKNNVYFEAPKKVNIVYYALLALFVSFISWAYLSEIEEITRGAGKVIPSSEVKVIQSLDGGIISKFYVKEGDLVQAGQPLLKLEDTRFSSNYNQSYTQLMALMSEAARFKAQVNFAEKITFPAVLNEYPDLKHSQTKLFNKIMSSYKKEKAALEQNVELSKQELEIVLPLVKDGLMSQLERIRLEKQLSEAKSNLSIMLGEFKTAAEADLTEKQNTIISLQEKLKGLEDQMTRTEIIAPVAGYIHNFKFNTVGGVIKSGVDVLEIVPIEEQVVIEAKINPRDRAFIRKEQSAVVKFPAYDSSIYGGLDARVISISPDTEKDEKNNEFYLVRLVTEKNYVNDDKLLTIIPGMTADVNILTGKKRILYYLLKPVTRFKENALRER